VLCSLSDDKIRKEAKAERREEMPKILRARVARDEQEERQIRKLAASRHGPADWIMHARMLVLSWEGKRVETIAQEVQCSAQTVCRRLHRFDAEGIEGLGDRPRSGRPSRLTEVERSKLIALVRKAAPGRLERQADELVAREEEGSAQWSLDALAQAAKEAGIGVKRSQIRTILLREGVRWRHTHSWGTSHDPDFIPKEQRSSAITLSRPRARRPSAPMSSGQ
jgi:transposase